MLLWRWVSALHQRRVDQRRQERHQQVDGLTNQERRHWVEHARLNRQLHNDATHISLRIQGLNDASSDDAILDVDLPCVCEYYLFDVSGVLGCMPIHVWWTSMTLFHLAMTETALSHMKSSLDHMISRFVCISCFIWAQLRDLTTTSFCHLFNISSFFSLPPMCTVVSWEELL